MKNFWKRVYSAIREKRLAAVIWGEVYCRILGMPSKLESFKYKKNSPYYNYLYSKDWKKDNTTRVDENLHMLIIKRIINSYKKAKSAQRSVPLPYQPGGEWRNIINAEYQPLIIALNKEDVSELKNLFSNFCRSTVSEHLDIGLDFRRFHKHGFSTRYVNQYLRQLHIWTSLIGDSKSLDSLSFPLIGNPFGPVIEGNLIPRCTIRHHYYATRLVDLATNIEKPVICEIGGGFGGMAYHLLSNKEKVFKYIDFDLPEVTAIISYFLMNAFPDKKVLLFGEGKTSSQAINSNDIILMPSFELPSLEDRSVDIVFNSISLVEMDEHTIAEYLRQIGRICRRFFIHINDDWYNDITYRGKPPKKLALMTSRNLEGTSFKRIYILPSLLESSLLESEHKHYECLYERYEGTK